MSQDQAYIETEGTDLMVTGDTPLGLKPRGFLADKGQATCTVSA